MSTIYFRGIKDELRLFRENVYSVFNLKLYMINSFHNRTVEKPFMIYVESATFLTKHDRSVTGGKVFLSIKNSRLQVCNVMFVTIKSRALVIILLVTLQEGSYRRSRMGCSTVMT